MKAQGMVGSTSILPSSISHINIIYYADGNTEVYARVEKTNIASTAKNGPTTITRYTLLQQLTSLRNLTLEQLRAS